MFAIKLTKYVSICVSMQNISNGSTVCVCVCRRVRESERMCLFVCVTVCLRRGRVQGGCSVQCPPKAKTSQASIFPDGTS